MKLPHIMRGASVFLMLVLWFAATEPSAASWKDDIGWTALQNELGSAMPDGTNITVSQIEGVYFGNYFPDTNTAQFVGKVFYDKTGIATGTSAHATQVGQYFYGTAGAGPQISGIDVYLNTNWLNDGFLQPGLQDTEPLIETNRIQNHSWVGNSSAASDLVRRLDYAIDRDGFTCMVGLNNNTNPLPQLLCYSYNSISIGRTDGIHSVGPTTNEVAGRVKPDLVAPIAATSWDTAVASGCAALLMDTADEYGMANGSRPQTIKALLLAGATKTEFGTNWNRTASRPLDEHYGAGELNIYNSWHILTNGEQNASATSLVNHIGWDYNELSAAETNWYFFDAPTNHAPSRFSVVLTWHRKITDGPGVGFNPEAFVANMDLCLYEADGFTTNDLVDLSTSQVDNVEHVFREALPPGRYALKVTSDAEAKYALAWHKVPAAVPEFTEVSYLSNTGFVLKVSTSPNVLYGIEATTNLMDSDSWISLETRIPVTSLWIYVDTQAVNYSERFYKAFVDPE